MKKVVGVALLAILMVFTFTENSIASAGSFDDILYEIAYNAGIEAAEEAGYTNYEIVVDEDYNVTINILDEPKTTDIPDDDKSKVEEEQNLEEINGLEDKLNSEEEFALGMQELEGENIVDAMYHFLRALPNDEAEKRIAENAYNYVDELMFAEEYQVAQAFMLDHPFDGYESMLAECNDYCFLLDLASGLNARWKISNQDSTTFSDEKMRQWYQQLVECETEYLNKYVSLGFSDPQLANYAYAYIGALQSQATGAAYFGIDSDKYNENWYDHGYNVRSRLIYLLNKKYGIETDSSLDQSFKDMIANGKNLDFVIAVSESLTEQLSSTEIPFTKYRDGDKSKGEWVYIAPFELKNTSGYETGSVDIDAVFLDDKGHVVYRVQELFVAYSATRDGEDYRWRGKDGYMVYETFASFYFECTFYDLNWKGNYFSVYPPVQTAWDGKEIIVNGRKTASDKDVMVALEETNAYWTSYSNYFTPCIEFILRNDGDAEIKEAIIECVFIDKDNNTEWSRDKYFALSLSDTPLSSGQGRNVIVYSNNGFEKKTRKVPNLAVEIYVNDEPVTKIDVTKP